jgi:hypothetical protein
MLDLYALLYNLDRASATVRVVRGSLRGLEVLSAEESTLEIALDLLLKVRVDLEAADRQLRKRLGIPWDESRRGPEPKAPLSPTSRRRRGL